MLNYWFIPMMSLNIIIHYLLKIMHWIEYYLFPTIINCSIKINLSSNPIIRFMNYIFFINQLNLLNYIGSFKCFFTIFVFVSIIVINEIIYLLYSFIMWCGDFIMIDFIIIILWWKTNYWNTLTDLNFLFTILPNMMAIEYFESPSPK